jgi:HPr kinase/phosphorylase
MATPTVHASAVLIGVHAVLIQGASGSGKSRLALALLQAADNGTLPFARLVGDDRIHLEAAHGRLLARPASALVGQIEVRGLGIRRVVYDPVAVVGLVVELGVAVERHPAAEQKVIVLSGIHLPRLPVAGGIDPLPVLLAHIRTGRTNP